MTFGNVRVDVHVLELDTELPWSEAIGDLDDAYLWSYTVPEAHLL